MLSKEAECLTDIRLEMKTRPLACKVSATCPLSKVFGNSAHLIYPETFVVFELKQTRESFGKWLVKLKFKSYIALMGDRNVTI